MSPEELQSSVDIIIKRYKSLGLTKSGLAFGFGLSPNHFYRVLSGDRPAPAGFAWMIKALVDGSYAPVLVAVQQSHSGPPKRGFSFESVNEPPQARINAVVTKEMEETKP